jgi:hypothetical protein
MKRGRIRAALPYVGSCEYCHIAATHTHTYTHMHTLVLPKQPDVLSSAIDTCVVSVVAAVCFHH